jgi:hypothetical protein
VQYATNSSMELNWASRLLHKHARLLNYFYLFIYLGGGVLEIMWEKKTRVKNKNINFHFHILHFLGNEL